MLKSKSKDSGVKKFAIGAAVAAFAGYLTGVLTAPKSGKDTRQDIKDTAGKGVSEAEKELKKLQAELTGLMDDIKNKGSDVSDKTTKEIDELVGKAKTAKDKASELLSAVRDGGSAEDAELKKAINDANKALEHVRKFLKK